MCVTQDRQFAVWMVQRGNKIRNFSPSGYLNYRPAMTEGSDLKSSVKSKLTWALAFKMRVKPWTVHGEFFRWAFFLREKRIQRQAHAFKWQMRVRGARCARKLFHHGPTSWRGRRDPFLKEWEEEKATHIVAVKYHFPRKGIKTLQKWFIWSPRIFKNRLDSQEALRND